MKLSPLAGKQAPVGLLIDVPWPIDAHYSGIPELAIPEQRITLGSSGHQGSSINRSFNEWHILARSCVYPGNAYKVLAGEFEETYDERTDAPATAAERAILAALSPNNAEIGRLDGERVKSTIYQAPSHGASLRGKKLVSAGGRFAARPFGTEQGCCLGARKYKIYAESFQRPSQLRRIQEEAQQVVSAALAPHSGPVGQSGTETKVTPVPGALRAATAATQTI